MSSPITLSGFNSIDFNVILNAEMQQASQPMVALQGQQTNIQNQIKNYGTLQGLISNLQTAAEGLKDDSDFAVFGATSTDTTALSATASSDAVAGHYDVVVKELARSQVTASASTAPDADTTAVATGGSITINGTAVNIASGVTLKGLAADINATDGVGVTATVVQSGAHSYRLVLTGSTTGSDGAFTVTNALTGGAGVSFTDTNGDGTSGDSAADNAVQATDADVLVNNVEAFSSTNTFDSAIQGVSFTVFKKDPDTAVGIDVSADSGALQTKLNTFISAYNAIATFASGQNSSAASGDLGSIGRDPLLRGLTGQIRAALNAAYGSGTFDRLSQVGVEFSDSGTLQLNKTTFSAAISDSTADVKSLFVGDSGAFTGLDSLLTSYTQAGGALSSNTTNLNNEVKSLGKQITRMQANLAIQQQSLQQEYTAADMAMTQLKSQTGSMTDLGTSLATSSVS